MAKTHAVLGVLPRILCDGPTTLHQIARQYPGEVPSFYLGPVRVYLVSQPHHLQYVFHDNWRNFVKGSMWKAIRPLLGNGLTTSDGEVWQRSRRLMQPLFSAKAISAISVLMTDMVGEAIPRFEKLAESGSTFDMHKEMGWLAQRVLLRALFGSSVPRKTTERLGASVNTAFAEINLRLFLYFLPEWVPLPGQRALDHAIATIDETMTAILGERRRSNIRRDDLLSMLIHAQEEDAEHMHDKQVRDELVTLFVAGQDTLAATMTWLWYALDQHPEVADRLQGEIDSVLEGREPTSADLPRLQYTKMVVQEVLRLYPTVWFLPRFVEREDSIDGYRLPAGSTILTCAYAAHRDPAFWPDPERFDPERFLPERSATRPRFAYLPFGGGPRVCIGMPFAYAEAQIITAMLLQRYRFRYASKSPAKPYSSITLQPRGGLPMIAERSMRSSVAQRG